MIGGGGNDTILAWFGADSIEGGDGDDYINAGAPGPSADQDGDDTISGGSGHDTVHGGHGDDVVEAGLGNDVVYGGAGNDYIDDGFGSYQAGGDDYFDGGVGDDEIWGGAGNDTIMGGDGDDTLSGEEGVDVVLGGDGNDYIWDGADRGDVFDGGADADIFYLWSVGQNAHVDGGEAVTAGGRDFDTLDLTQVWWETARITLTGDERGTATVAGETMTFQGIEALKLGDQNDVVDASADRAGLWIDSGGGNDTVLGGAGADTIQGGAGRDRLDGGGGDDRFVMDQSLGRDTVIGGANGDGGDTIDLSATAAPVRVTYDNTGSGSISDGSAMLTFREIERLIGSDGDDQFDASADQAGVVIEAGGGNDLLIGGAGDDVLDGGSGSDTFWVESGQGADEIVGGEGWTDLLRIIDGGGPVQVTGNVIDGNGWTAMLGDGHSVTSTSDGTATLSDDAAGIVTFDDGDSVAFRGVEQINW